MSGGVAALGRSEREELWRRLAAMADFLEGAFGELSAEEATRRGPGELWGPVEQSWHLADLEREGFGVRIRRILAEEGPSLPDFDGERAALERGYRTKSVQAGVAAFREARSANLELLRRVTEEQWGRSGVQDGVGRVTLGDLPRMMAEHDAEHRAQIALWREQAAASRR